jgi:hypothetical protein
LAELSKVLLGDERRLVTVEVPGLVEAAQRTMF